MQSYKIVSRLKPLLATISHQTLTVLYQRLYYIAIQILSMRLKYTVFILLLLSSTAQAQKITGIWRGYFSSVSGLYGQKTREENYKYEIQIDQQSTNGVKGVTYSYKTTVFYGKAELSGIYNPTTKSLIIKESKLVDLKIIDKSEPCLMTCYLDYSKIGKLEVLEGTFISINVKDKGDCGSGKVYLEKVTTSDLKKEDFLLKKKNSDSIKSKAQAAEKPKQAISLPSGASSGKKDNLTSKVIPIKPAAPPQQKPAAVIPNTKQPLVKKPVEKAQAKNKPVTKEDKPVVNTKPVERVQEEGIRSKKKDLGETQGTETTSKKIQIPKVLLERENSLARTITTSEEDIVVDLYDNGTIDNDTISVYHNNKLVINNGRLTYSPLTIRLKCNKTDSHHEIVVVAENLGDIPPNTAYMVIKAGGYKERYEINLVSTEQRNAKVIINYVPKK